MRISRTLAAVFLLAGLPASAGDLQRKTWTFEDETPGAIASGFAGSSGEWKVVLTSEGKALAQLAESPDAAFNVALVDGIRSRDVDLSVRIKAVAGENDQGGGLVWRARDRGNYYVARFNHKEDNFRVYKVVEGVRSSPLRNAEVKHHAGWTLIRVTMKGDRIECFLDGKKTLEVNDATFPDAGRIGVWSKSDARSLFDDLTLSGD